MAKKSRALSSVYMQNIIYYKISAYRSIYPQMLLKCITYIYIQSVDGEYRIYIEEKKVWYTISSSFCKRKPAVWIDKLHGYIGIKFRA